MDKNWLRLLSNIVEQDEDTIIYKIYLKEMGIK